MMKPEGAAQHQRGTSLQLHGINAGYGAIQALHDVSVTVEAGEFVAVVGANGAGKTTLLNLAAGLVRPWKGAITVGGDDVTERSAYRRVLDGMGLVPEGRRVFPRMTVQENLMVGAHNRTDGTGVLSDLADMQALFPILKERSNQAAGTLSGGEQQMLAIARALMGRPRLLLLDEPSMGVAPLLVRTIFEAIKRLHDRGLSVLVVEQNARLALSMATRGYVMESGRMRLEGPASSLLNNPDVQRAYLGVSVPDQNE